MKIDNFIEGSLREEQANQNLSELEYNEIFSKIENEVVNNKEEMITGAICKIKGGINKLKKYFSFREVIAVTAFVLLLTLVPAISGYFSKNHNLKDDNTKQTNLTEKDLQEKGLTRVPWDYSDRIIIIDTPLYEEADSNSRQIKTLGVGTVVMIEDAVKDNKGKFWYKVVIPTDSSDGNKGWIGDLCCRNALAMIPAKGNSISNEDIKKLTEEYLNYLQLERIGLDKRIAQYKVSEIKMGLINDIDMTFYAQYDVKPSNIKKFSVPYVNELSGDGWVKGIYSAATVIKVKDVYVLINMNTAPSEFYYEGYKAAVKLLEEKGLTFNVVTWFSRMIEVPASFSTLQGNNKELGLYFAYCAELSKEQGYDMSKCKGKKIQIIGGSVTKKDSPDKYYEVAILYYENKICGAWMEIPDCFTVGKKIQTLDGKSFDDIVKNKEQWYIENGFSNWKNLDKLLAERAQAAEGNLIYYSKTK